MAKRGRGRFRLPDAPFLCGADKQASLLHFRLLVGFHGGGY